MKASAFIVVAALAAGCSASPTSPSSPADLTSADVAVSQDASSGHAARAQKVTIYFWSDDDPSGGNQHLIGLPVHYADSAIPANGGLLYTGKQGEVSFQLPGTDTSVRLWTDCFVEREQAGDEVYPAAGPWTIPLPYGLRQNFILVHGAPGEACPVAP